MKRTTHLDLIVDKIPLSRPKIAKALGLTYPHLWQILNGDRRASVDRFALPLVELGNKHGVQITLEDIYPKKILDKVDLDRT